MAFKKFAKGTSNMLDWQKSIIKGEVFQTYDSDEFSCCPTGNSKKALFCV